MRRALRPLLVCGAVLVSQTASAQQPAAQPPPQPTFQSAVTLVTSDLIVRDRRGQFQANLGQDIDEPIDTVEWQTHLRKQQDSLRVMADLTGGIAVVNTNDFAKALKQIDAETSDYYILGYYSTNPDPTQRRRAIEITLTGKRAAENLDLQYRHDYTLKPPARR